MSPREQAVRFGPWRSLAGVVTHPAEEGDAGAASEKPAVLFLNAGLLHHIGPHRLHVQMARRLAALGHRCLRFDLSGLGDSGPRRDTMGQLESTVAETREAMDLLERQHGHGAFVLFGLCAGADQAVRTALEDERVTGAVLVDGYAYRTRGHMLHHYAQRLLRLRSWWNLLSLRHPGYGRVAARLRHRLEHQTPEPVDAPDEHGAVEATPVETGAGEAASNGAAPRGPRPGVYIKPPREVAEARFRALLQRGCHLCCVYTPSRHFNHKDQWQEMFPSLARNAALRVDFLEHSNHVFTLRASQQALADAVEDWLGAARFPAPATAPR